MNSMVVKISLRPWMLSNTQEFSISVVALYEMVSSMIYLPTVDCGALPPEWDLWDAIDTAVTATATISAARWSIASTTIRSCGDFVFLSS